MAVKASSKIPHSRTCPYDAVVVSGLFALALPSFHNPPLSSMNHGDVFIFIREPLETGREKLSGRVLSRDVVLQVLDSFFLL
jgi:hypothetical protein